MQITKRILAQGALAGVFAAAALALWFFAIDLIRDRPLYTPAFMASALLGRETVELSVPLIVGYTILHFATWALAGLIVAWLLQATETRPYIVLGPVLGFLMFDIVFYFGVITVGSNIVNRLGWPQVLAGNVIAGITLLAWLRSRAELAGTSLRDRWATNRVLREAVISGLIGAGVIALWFLATDLIRGRLLFTPAALGSALFLGARGAEQVQITFGIVAGYSLVHVATFLIAGLVASLLLSEAEKHPSLLFGIVLLFVTLETLFFGSIVIIANWLLDALNWWTVLVSNLLAAAAMGIYLLRRHPGLRAELNKPLEEDEFLTR